MIGPSKFEKIEKNGFGTESDPVFGTDFRCEGVSIGRNLRNCGVSGPFEISENRNGFRFPLLLTEIYAIGKRYYFPKIGPFRSITPEPEFEPEFELSENRNGFRFPLLLTEIYAIGKRYYFPKIGPFRSITPEPEFSRTCGFL